MAGQEVDDLVEEHSLDELKAMADDRGLATYGTKAQLAARIAEHDHDDQDESEPDAEYAEDEVVVGGDVDSAEVDAKQPDDTEPEPEPVRAGGYIDRGDGQGWVLDDSPQPQPNPDPHAEPVDPGTREDEAPLAGGKAGGWTLTAAAENQE